VANVAFAQEVEYSEKKAIPTVATPTAQTPTPVEIKPSAAQAGFHRHDGFFLRLSEGLGYGQATASDNGNDYKYSGITTIMDIAIGYSVIENLAITADLFGGIQINPKRTVNGHSVSTSGIQLDSLGFGVGATYYFMPLNLYANLGIGVAEMVLDAGNTRSETNTGGGFHVGVGKEWWVSDNWGLGLAGQFFYMAVPVEDVTFHDIGFGVSFSATYN